MDQEDNEILADTAAEYSSKSDFSKAEVVQKQVVKCSEIRSKEMREGYYNFDGPQKKIYVPDARREWISAVTALKTLLEPELRRDNIILGAINKVLEKIKKVFDEYAYTPRNKDEVKDPNNPAATIIGWFKLPNAKPYIPEVDATLITDDPSKPKSKYVIDKVGLWNNQVHQYWNEMVSLYDELYAELQVLIDKNNYFKKQARF